MQLKQHQRRRGLDTGARTMPRVSNDPGLMRGVNALVGAVNSLAVEEKNMQARLAAEERQREGFKAQTRFIEMGNTLEKGMLEARQEIAADGAGFATQQTDLFDTQSKIFLESLPKELQEQYAPKLAALRGNFTLNAAKMEYGQRNKFYQDGVIDLAGRLEKGLQVNPDGYQVAEQQISEMIGMTGLNPVQKQQVQRKAMESLRRATLQGFASSGRLDDARKLAASWDQAGNSGSGAAQKVVRAGKGFTDIQLSSGAIVRREGARNWRNNNPGNLVAGKFATKHGSIGKDGPFAVFPDQATGRKAMESLLFKTDRYKSKTIAGALKIYAPPHENDTGRYIAHVAKAVGVQPNTKMSALNPDQRTALVEAMTRYEGFKEGKETELKAGGGANGTLQAPMSFDWKRYRTGGALRPDGISGMKPAMQRNLAAFLQAADKELGPGMQVYSGYRSNKLQASLFANAVKKYGSAKKARKWVAPPGRSKHNVGKAADLKFNGVRIDQVKDKRVAEWIRTNAPKYGLNVRMSWEPWQVELVEGQSGQVEQAGGVGGAGGVSGQNAQIGGQKGDYSLIVDRLANRAEAARTKQSLATFAELDLRLAKDEALTVNDIDNNPHLTDQHKARLIRKIRSNEKRVTKQNGALARLQGEPDSFNPYNKHDQKAVDDIYTAQVSTGGIFDKDKKKSREAAFALSALVQKTGIVPMQAIENTRAALNSGDAKRVGESLMVASSLVGENEQYLSARKGGKELSRAGREYDFYVNKLGMDPQKVAERFIYRQSPDFQTARKAREEQLKAGKLLEGLKVDEVYSAWFSSDPDIGFTSAQQISIAADYKEAVRQHYLDTGDIKLAEHLAKEDLVGPSGVYGVTQINGSKVVMRYPPEKVYAPYLNPETGKGSIDDIAAQAAKDVSAAFGKTISREQIGFVVDSAAAKAIKAGKPKYRLVVRQKTKDGNEFFQMMPAYFVFDADSAVDKRWQGARRKQGGLEKVIDASGKEVLAEIKTGRLMAWDAKGKTYKPTGETYKPPRQTQPKGPAGMYPAYKLKDGDYLLPSGTVLNKAHFSTYSEEAGTAKAIEDARRGDVDEHWNIAP